MTTGSDATSPLQLPVFAKLDVHVLSSGVSLYVLYTDVQPAVRLDIVLKDAGTWHQEKSLQALFTNRMLREGTTCYTSSQLAEQLDALGAWLELSVSVNCSFITLYALRRTMPAACELLRTMLMEPTFPEDSFATIRANNRQQFLVNSQRGEVVARRLLGQTLYGEAHPCGRFACEADFEAITPDDVRRFWQTHYSSDVCTMYMAGAVDEALLSVVEHCFGTRWGTAKAGTMVQEDALLPPPPAAVQHIRQTLPTQAQASLRMGTLLMDVGTDEYYRMRVVTTLLGGYFGSRLMKRVREEKGYTYGISADMVTNTRRVLFTVMCEAMADKVDEVVTEVQHEIERLCTELVPDAELALVRNYMLGEVCRNYESPFSLVDAYIYLHTFGLDDDHLSRTVSEAFHITPEEIREVARRWLSTHPLTTVAVVP